MSFRSILALTVLFWASACAQTDGEVCQVKNDCEGSLICCKSGGIGSGGNPDERGICRTEDACRTAQNPDAGTSTEPDAAVIPDSSIEDASLDAEVTLDGTVSPDSSTSQDSGSDSGSKVEPEDASSSTPDAI